MVKGQGEGPFYARPLWRSCGDVDFFFDAENYERVKGFLTQLAASVDPEEKLLCGACRELTNDSRPRAHGHHGGQG